MGHIISGQGVKADLEKLREMVDGLKPKTLKALKGVLGLMSYYRRFIKNYGVIATALFTLTKNNNFQWNEEADLAFIELKKVMTQPPVLTLPDFLNAFIVECNASSKGVGAVLIQ